MGPNFLVTFALVTCLVSMGATYFVGRSSYDRGLRAGRKQMLVALIKVNFKTISSSPPKFSMDIKHDETNPGTYPFPPELKELMSPPEEDLHGQSL